MDERLQLLADALQVRRVGVPCDTRLPPDHDSGNLRTGTRSYPGAHPPCGLRKCLEGLSKGKAIALDGKVIRGSADGESPARHLLAAITHGEGVVVAQQKVEEKTNEIPGAKPLLEPLDLEGSTVTADAMHTQTDLARFLVEEKKAHYVLIAKGNQPTLLEDIKTLDWGRFPPSGRNLGQGARADRDAEDLAEG